MLKTTNPSFVDDVVNASTKVCGFYVETGNHPAHFAQTLLLHRDKRWFLHSYGGNATALRGKRGVQEVTRDDARTWLQEARRRTKYATTEAGQALLIEHRMEVPELDPRRPVVLDYIRATFPSHVVISAGGNTYILDPANKELPAYIGDDHSKPFEVCTWEEARLAYARAFRLPA